MSNVSIEALYSCRPSVIWRFVRTQHISFWLVCGYLFFEYVRPQSIYESLAAVPLTGFFALAALAASFIDGRVRSSFNTMDKCIVAFSVVVLLSTATSQFPAISASQLNLYFTWVLVYFAIVRIVCTPQRFFVFLLLYLLCNLKMSQHGFLSWVFRGFAFEDWGVSGAPGWFQNSGEFGIEMCIYVPLSACFVLGLRSRWGTFMRWFFYFFPISGAGSVIASSSRGAMLGLAAAGLYSLRTTRYFLRSVLALGVVFVVILAATPAEFKDRFRSSGEDRTSLHRLDRWSKGMDTIRKYPVLGVGYKAWTPYYHRNLSYGPRGSTMVHNIFIECATETGLVGIAVLAAIILAMFRLSARAMQHPNAAGDPFVRSMAIGMQVAAVGLFASASFVTVLYYPFVWIHAALVSSLYGCVQRARWSEAAEPVAAGETDNGRALRSVR